MRMCVIPELTPTPKTSTSLLPAKCICKLCDYANLSQQIQDASRRTKNSLAHHHQHSKSHPICRAFRKPYVSNLFPLATTTCTAARAGSEINVCSIHTSTQYMRVCV